MSVKRVLETRSRMPWLLGLGYRGSGKASLVITRRNICVFKVEMQNDARG
jgi:hypothetical protein